jgi:hypothetical protein
VIVTTKYGERIALTDHALDRYRQRVSRDAAPEEIARVVMARRSGASAPAWAFVKWAFNGLQDGFLIGPGWALVLRRPDERDANRNEIDFVATTCIAKPRMSKEQIRALREQAAEDREWAA